MLQNLPSVFHAPNNTWLPLSPQSLSQHKTVPLALDFQSKFPVDISMEMSLGHWNPVCSKINHPPSFPKPINFSFGFLHMETTESRSEEFDNPLCLLQSMVMSFITTISYHITIYSYVLLSVYWAPTVCQELRIQQWTKQSNSLLTRSLLQ